MRKEKKREEEILRAGRGEKGRRQKEANPLTVVCLYLRMAFKRDRDFIHIARVGFLDVVGSVEINTTEWGSCRRREK